MNHKIRLGPIAVFFTVIAAVLATLAILTVATSRADYVLAERFASVTQIRYGLEADGNRFLKELEEGGMPQGAVSAEDGMITWETEKDGYMLTVAVQDTGDGYAVRTWKIEKIWENENTGLDLWPGMRRIYTMSLQDILREAVEKGASDIFLIAGLPVTYKVKGQQIRSGTEKMAPDTIAPVIDEIYEVAKRAKTNYDSGIDDDFSFSIHELGRFRVNVFRQRGSVAAVIRVIRFGIPDPEVLGIPESVLSLADNKTGLVLVAGAAGSGKSTTLACMIDRINRSRECHVITMEDPIEYIHAHGKSIVSQREVFIDTPGYLDSLRSALRESPDVILLGEMRDFDTISSAITAAETGVLLFSTLHTSSAANTINRIVDVFPANQQIQVRGQLAQLIRGVVCQQLVTGTDGTLIPVFEVMKSNPAIQNMIREGKLHQLESAMQSAAQDGMTTMDGSLLALVKQGRIAKETALSVCSNYEFMSKRIGV